MDVINPSLFTLDVKLHMNLKIIFLHCLSYAVGTSDTRSQETLMSGEYISFYICLIFRIKIMNGT
jgi:hypothetical protein